jgi:CRISPR-associated protein Csd2
MTPADLIPADIRELYEVHDYGHAATILAVDFPDEAGELWNALRTFRFTDADVIAPGGNETAIPKRLSRILHPLGWEPDNLKAKMMVDDVEVSRDTHIIDYVKGRIAFDLEWNSKDQTFDRDLAAFRAFFDYGRISVGVLLTRDSDTMVPYFRSLGTFVDGNGKTRQVLNKYGGMGGSTTHMNQLLERLEAGRAGGCPVLALGITSKLRVEG